MTSFNLIFISLLIIKAVILLPGMAMAGDLEPPAAPSDAGSAMYTLEDLYNRTNTGEEGIKRGAGFDGPIAGPGSTGYNIDEIMGKMPAKDNIDGALSGDVCRGKKYWGLNVEWGLQTGTKACPCELGERFYDMEDGTIKDCNSGLLWLKDATEMGTANWADGAAVASTLSDGEHGLTDGSSDGDWRLPTKEELEAFIDTGYSNPTLCNAAGDGQWSQGDAFNDVLTGGYWSGTSFDPTKAWIVNTYLGLMLNGTKYDAYYVWPVRYAN